jgi:hypothetical protein
VGSLLGRRTIVLVLVLVHVHDLTFAYTSSCTYNVYRCAVKVYDLPASRASGEKVGSGQFSYATQTVARTFLSVPSVPCARLLSKVGTALLSGPPVVAGNQNCFDSGLGADLIDHIEIASPPRRFWKNTPYPNSLLLIPRLRTLRRGKPCQWGKSG